MDGEDSRELTVFSEALEVPPEERDAFLARACAGNEGLRRKVEKLLATHGQVGDFLEEPAAEPGRDRPSEPGGEEKPGDSIGHYKLLEQIGEGGCGVVYMAEQSEPVRRLVALKIIKPGMDTKSVIVRFEAERQALALMDHPNIASVFDAGRTSAGRPYVVMELVRGVKITEFCDQHSLTTRERLLLFIRVCQAVQHAHQKGIIHRDIKPSNILVATSDEGEPIPKVIDFGLAKATTGLPLTDKTLFTAFDLLIGTPAYMSPEQAELRSIDVDSRSDIYSLGVLLYELLTGTTPFDIQVLLQAGLDEIRRVIQSEDPVRPSTRLKTMMTADLTAISQRRAAEPPKLIRTVRGDLDWIVMKALEKDRRRRYETANDFAVDVQRFIAGEAISARPPSSLYKLQKLILRNKLFFGAVSAVLISSLAGLIMTTWSLSQEKKARRDAEASRRNAENSARLAKEEATRSQQVSKLLEQMVQGVGPSVAKGRDTTILKEMLKTAADRMEKELTNQPAVEAEMWYTMGAIYRQIGEFDTAKNMAGKALAIYRRIGETNDDNVARVLYELGKVKVLERRDLQEAFEELSESLRIRTNLFGPNNLDVIETAAQLGFVYMYLGSNQAALLLESNAVTAGRISPMGQSDGLLNAELALAAVSANIGNGELAENTYQAALREQIRLHGEDSLWVATVISKFGEFRERQSRPADAEELYIRCIEIRKKLLGAENRDTRAAQRLLGAVYQHEDKFNQAAEVYRDLMAVKAPPLGGWIDSAVNDAANLAWCLEALGKSSEAKSVRAEFQSEHPDLAGTLLAIEADQLAQRGRVSEAEALATNASKMNLQDFNTRHTLAPLLAYGGDREDYEALCGQIVKEYGGTTDFYAADRMAKDCLILPRPGANLQPAAALANLAISAGEDLPGYPFFIVCKALAEYRQEHWKSAAEWSERASKSTFPYSQAEGCALLAMSQWRLQRLDEARQSLAACREEVKTRLPELDSPNLGQDWRDCIIARLLLQEAVTLLEGAPASTNNLPPETR